MGTWSSALITPTVTAGAYTNGDAVGAVQSITGVPEHGTINTITIIDDADQGNGFDIFFFRKTVTGVADNAAFNPSDADMGECIGAVNLDTWFDATSSQFLSVDNISLSYWAPEGVLYFQLKINDASPPTYAATNDLHIRVSIVY